MAHFHRRLCLWLAFLFSFGLVANRAHAIAATGGALYYNNQTKSYFCVIESRVNAGVTQYRMMCKWGTTTVSSGSPTYGGYAIVHFLKADGSNSSPTWNGISGMPNGDQASLNSPGAGTAYTGWGAPGPDAAKIRITVQLTSGGLSSTIGSNKMTYFALSDVSGGLRSIGLSYTNNTNQEQHVGVENSAYPGLMLEGYIGVVPPGGTYSVNFGVEPGDTSTYRLVSIDHKAAFAAGGGSVNTFYAVDANGNKSGSLNYDFSGFTTPLTSSKGYVDGVATDYATTPTGAPGAVNSGATPSGIPGPVLQPVTSGQTATGVIGISSSPAGGLTVADYNAGINGINSQLNQIKGMIGSGSGGGGSSNVTVDFSGVNSRLDTANGHLSGISTKLDTANTSLEKLGTQADTVAALQDGTPSISDMSDEGMDKGAEAKARVPGGGMNTQPSQISVAGGAPSFVITFPAVMGGGAVNLNPFGSDRFGGVVDWFRTATSWAVIVTFGVWASLRVSEWVRGASQIRQAKGNAVVAGTGAQATALLAAGVITVFVSTFFVAIFGWLYGDFALSSILAILPHNPLTGLASGAVWMLDRCFPIATMVAALVARVGWNFYASSVFAFAMTAIRFVVP